MDKLSRYEADLAQVDQEILRLARENEKCYPAMSFNDIIQKVIADHPGLGRRKRALQDSITVRLIEMGGQTRGMAA